MLKPIPEQQPIIEAVLNGENIAVNAVPGGGKTTMFRILDQELKRTDFTVLTFSRSLADEMIGKFAYAKANTLYGHGLQALKKYVYVNSIPQQSRYENGKFIRTVVHPDTTENAIFKYLKKAYDIHKYIPKILASEFWSDYNDINSLVTLIRREAIHYNDVVNIHEKYDASYTPEIVEMAIDILTITKDLFFLRGMADFEMMLYLPVCEESIKKYLELPKILGIDETQDSNKLMQEFYKLIVTDETQVILVGDNQQAIHGWNGVSLESFYQLQEMFNCILYEYNVTFRLPIVLTNYLNTSGLQPNIKPYNNHTGKIEYISYNKAVMSELKNGDWLLGRFNRHKSVKSLEEISLELLELGKHVRLLGSDYIAICENMLKKTELPKVGFKNIIPKIKKVIDKELELLAEEKGKDSFAVRKLTKEFDLFSRYFHFYCRKVGMPSAKGFVVFLNNMYETSDNSITLCTYHRAKGREAKRIFVKDVQLIIDEINNQELDPSIRKEAANLLFVGITRTLDELYVIDDKLPEKFEGIYV